MPSTSRTGKTSTPKSSKPSKSSPSRASQAGKRTPVGSTRTKMSSTGARPKQEPSHGGQPGGTRAERNASASGGGSGGFGGDSPKFKRELTYGPLVPSPKFKRELTFKIIKPISATPQGLGNQTEEQLLKRERRYKRRFKTQNV